MTPKYTIYNTSSDGFFYNRANSCISFTEDIKYARMKHTIADVFKFCCILHEKEQFDLKQLVVVEVFKEEGEEAYVNFESPVWSGHQHDISDLWFEVEEHLKALCLRGLYEDGMTMMHKITEKWYLKELGLGP